MFQCYVNLLLYCRAEFIKNLFANLLRGSIRSGDDTLFSSGTSLLAVGSFLGNRM